MLLRDIVDTSRAVASTRARSAKIEALAACIVRMQPVDVAAGVAFLAGEPRQPRALCLLRRLLIGNDPIAAGGRIRQRPPPDSL